MALLLAYAGVEVVGRVVAIVVARVAPQVVGRAHVVRVAGRLAARLFQHQTAGRRGHDGGGGGGRAAAAAAGPAAAGGGDVCNTSRDAVKSESGHLTCVAVRHSGSVSRRVQGDE